MFVYQVAGRLVRNPYTGEAISPGGEDVDLNDPNWLRLLRDGDITTDPDGIHGPSSIDPLNIWAVSRGTLPARISARSAAGGLYTLDASWLPSPVAFARTAGDTNLSIDASSGLISAAAAIAGGQRQTITGTVTDANDQVLPFTVILRVPAPGENFAVIGGGAIVVEDGQVEFFLPA